MKRSHTRTEHRTSFRGDQKMAAGAKGSASRWSIVASIFCIAIGSGCTPPECNDASDCSSGICEEGLCIGGGGLFEFSIRGEDGSPADGLSLGEVVRIELGGGTQISTDDCVVSADSGDAPKLEDGSSWQHTPVRATTNYTLTCASESGEVSQTAVATLRVPTVELTDVPTESLARGESFIIKARVTNVDRCTASAGETIECMTSGTETECHLIAGEQKLISVTCTAFDELPTTATTEILLAQFGLNLAANDFWVLPTDAPGSSTDPTLEVRLPVFVEGSDASSVTGCAASINGVPMQLQSDVFVFSCTLTDCPMHPGMNDVDLRCDVNGAPKEASYDILALRLSEFAVTFQKEDDRLRTRHQVLPLNTTCTTRRNGSAFVGSFDVSTPESIELWCGFDGNEVLIGEVQGFPFPQITDTRLTLTRANSAAGFPLPHGLAIELTKSHAENCFATADTSILPFPETLNSDGWNFVQLPETSLDDYPVKVSCEGLLPYEDGTSVFVPGESVRMICIGPVDSGYILPPASVGNLERPMRMCHGIIGDLEFYPGNTYSDFSAAEIEAVTGEINLTWAPLVDFPKLVQAGPIQGYNGSVSLINLPALTTIAGTLELSELPSLTELSMPSLRSVDRQVKISGTDISVPLLTIFAPDAFALRQTNLSALQPILINDNGDVSCSDVSTLVARIKAHPETTAVIPGNDGGCQ